jgi:hypothetical protein
LIYLQGQGQQMMRSAIQIGTIAGGIQTLFAQPLNPSSIPVLVNKLGRAWQTAEKIQQDLVLIHKHITTTTPHLPTMVLTRVFLSQFKALELALQSLIFVPLQQKAQEIAAYQQSPALPNTSASSEEPSLPDPAVLESQIKADLKKRVAALRSGQKTTFWRKFGEHMGAKGSSHEVRKYAREHYLKHPAIAQQILDKMNTGIKRYHTHAT